MKSCLVIVLFLKMYCVENRMLPYPYTSYTSVITETPDLQEDMADEIPMHEKVLGLKKPDVSQPETGEEVYSYGDSFFGQGDKCAVLVMSNQGQTNLQQSLLRKYRYNQDGELIPSSVKYFIKFPQGQGAALLVPLKDKAFSPSGGFVRYYKEVPPIPQSWNL